MDTFQNEYTKNKWVNQKIHKRNVMKRRRAKSSWRHYHQLKSYKRYLRKQKRNNLRSNMKYFYEEEQNNKSYLQPLDNTIKTKTQFTNNKRQNNTQLDIVIKINVINNLQSNDQTILNINLNIFDHFHQQYWPAFTFIPSLKYERESITDEFNNKQFMHVIQDNVLISGVNLNGIANAAIRKRFPEIICSYPHYRGFDALLHYLQPWSKNNNGYKMSMKETLYCVIPQLWMMYNIVIEFIGYDEICTILMKNTLDWNLISHLHLKQSAQYKPFAIPSNQHKILIKNCEGIPIRIGSRWIHKKQIQNMKDSQVIKHFYNVPLVCRRGASCSLIEGLVDKYLWNECQQVDRRYYQNISVEFCSRRYENGSKLITEFVQYGSKLITKHRQNVRILTNKIYRYDS